VVRMSRSYDKATRLLTGPDAPGLRSIKEDVVWSWLDVPEKLLLDILGCSILPSYLYDVTVRLRDVPRHTRRQAG